MIVVDSRSGPQKGPNTDVDKLVGHIRRFGVNCEKDFLEFGDFAFEANGPNGRILIGVERKTLHDALHMIDDARYAAHQKPGMAQLYSKSFLIVEGHWRYHDPEGWLMEGFQGGTVWGPCRYRTGKTLYAKLFRYLLSVSLSGVTVIYSRDLAHTAYNLCEMYTYFQKRWEDHTSLIETQKLHIPDFNAKPALVRRWAADIQDIGVKYSIEAQSLFKTPIALANADESAWMRIRGIGAKTAISIIKQIRGLK